MQSPPKYKRGKRGFQAAGRLVEDRIKKASASRGFAMERLLTHWSEVVGPELANICSPVSVTYKRKGGFGATLTLLVRGAAAPLVKAQEPLIRERVNACYGYTAISRLKYTQSSAHAPGFAEAQAAFAPKPKPAEPEITEVSRQAVATVSDPGLREALARLGAHILPSEK